MGPKTVWFTIPSRNTNMTVCWHSSQNLNTTTMCGDNGRVNSNVQALNPIHPILWTSGIPLLFRSLQNSLSVHWHTLYRPIIEALYWILFHPLPWKTSVTVHCESFFALGRPDVQISARKQATMKVSVVYFTPPGKFRDSTWNDINASYVISVSLTNSDPLQAERSEVRIPERATDFLFSKIIQTGSETLSASYSMGTGVFCPGVKRPVRVVDYAHPPNAEVKNACSYIYTPTVYLHGLGRENSTFTVFTTTERHSPGNWKRREINHTQIQFLARSTTSDIKCSDITPK